MPRDNDKNNGRPSGGRGAPPRREGGGFKGGAGKGRPGSGGSRGGDAKFSRDDRPARSSAPRSSDRKFGDKKFGDKPSGDKRPYAPRDGDAKPYKSKPYGSKPYGSVPQGSKPYASKRSDARGGPSERSSESRPRANRDERPQRDERPARFNRDDRPARDDRAPRKDFAEKRDFKPRTEGRAPFKPRDDRGASKDFKPREDRGPRKDFKPREDRGPRKDFKPREDRGPRKDFGEKRDFKPRGEGRAPFKPREDRGPRKDFDRGSDRGPRKEFDRGADKPWQKRAPARSDSRDDTRRDSRPPAREGARRFDKPREDRGSRPDFKPREDRGSRPDFKPRSPRPDFKPREDRNSSERPRFSRPREDRPERGGRDERGPGRNANRTEWQEHPRSENRESSRDNREERPRRDNEDDSKIFAKRPAFGGRGEYRERSADADRRPPRAAPEKKKSGERIAKLVSRAGMCSRRDAEEWIVEGRVAVNGRVINSPALDVTSRDVVTVDGKPLPERERTRLFLYHKPRGLMTTHADPEGRPTVFDNLPEDLPRLISIGRLDFNTEGLLLLTNDGGLARALELPDTGWLRRYRVRAHGEVTQAQLDALKKGVEVDGVKYGSIDATLERDKSANVWIVFAIREGKNREVRNVMAHLGLEVNRLIRISYGPFQLAELGEGEVEEVKTRVLREQLGEKIAASAGAQFDKPMQENAVDKAPREKGKRVKPLGKNGLIADRKGRRVLVQRTGGEEARARNEEDASGFGPPRRPQRGYRGKRDLKPRD